MSRFRGSEVAFLVAKEAMNGGYVQAACRFPGLNSENLPASVDST